MFDWSTHAMPGPAFPVRLHSLARGDVAQLGEHRVRIAGVRGSSPLISTTLLATIPTRPRRTSDPDAPSRPCRRLAFWPTDRCALDLVSASEAVVTRRMSAPRQDAAHEDAEGWEGRQGRTAGSAEGEIGSSD